MSRIKKGMVAAAAVVTVGAAGLTATQAVMAATGNTTSPDASLVEKIASKFGLSKTDVQQVFDEDRSEREAEHEAEVTERLQTLVDKGTITSDQKTAIEAKLKEMKAEREANKDNPKSLSDDERKAKMEEKKTELESWAKQNGLDLSKLTGVFMGGHGGPGGPAPDAQ